MHHNADPSLPTRWSLLSRLKDWEDQESWRQFFDAYGQLIYHTACKAGLSHTEAQEVVQEVVISVAKKMGEFKTDPSRCSFKSWLFNLTRSRVTHPLPRTALDSASQFSFLPEAHPTGCLQGAKGGQNPLPDPLPALGGGQLLRSIL